MYTNSQTLLRQHFTASGKYTVLVVLFFCLTVFFYAEETIIFKSNRMNGNAGENSEYTVLTGNAYIKSDSLEVYADTIELSGKDFRFISAKGNVKGRDTESGFDFISDELAYDRTTKISILTGNVTMDDNTNEVKASAGRIEYNQNNEIAFMQINVKILQKKNVCTATRAIYRRKESLLELLGNAIVTKKKESGKEDVFSAQEININIDTEEIILGGNVKGTVSDE